ncbi:MAG: serine/threonine-protein kinase, partial [Planctomycetota bacterium]
MPTDDSFTGLYHLCNLLESRLRSGERGVARELLAKNEWLADDTTSALELIYREYCVLETLGQQPSESALLDAFPEWQEEIRRLLEVHDAFLDESEAPAPSAETSPGTNLIGRIIGRYKLLEEIGEGGFGVVYMAEQLAPIRRMVAIKVIKPGMDTRAAVARFEAERQALALMDHPNISRVFDAGTTEFGRPYFVMELVKGMPITDFCRGKGVPLRERLKLFQTVCSAVQHAHSKSLIHRDLKPTNVMVTFHDGVPVPKIIDFGISKALNQRLTEKTLFTRYGQMLGTPMYMSPEQAEMSGLDVDIRADIYSLGVLLYELVTGTPPFSHERLKSAPFLDVMKIITEEE